MFCETTFSMEKDRRHFTEISICSQCNNSCCSLETDQNMCNMCKIICNLYFCHIYSFLFLNKAKIQIKINCAHVAHVLVCYMLSYMLCYVKYIYTIVLDEFKTMYIFRKVSEI